MKPNRRWKTKSAEKMATQSTISHANAIRVAVVCLVAGCCLLFGEMSSANEPDVSPSPSRAKAPDFDLPSSDKDGGKRSDLPPWSKLTKELCPRLRDEYSRPPNEWPAPIVDNAVKWEELGIVPPVAHPPSNPFCEKKVELGQTLFFDRRLSRAGDIACATCHNPQRGWANAHASRSDNSLWPMRRDPPSLRNVGHRRTLHWDGAADSLEQQAVMALQAPDQMDSTPEHVLRRLRQTPDYVKRFAAAFGQDGVTLKNVSKALAAYQRTCTGIASYFDDFLRGNQMALSDEALYGLHIFRTNGRCINCHHGPNLTDEKFHDVGLSYYRREYEDLGRYYVTRRPGDSGRFRTPSLRNVSRTGPYMHRGTFSLDGVLNMLNHGMPTLPRDKSQPPDPLFPQKSPLFHRLDLTQAELAYIKCFLESLAEKDTPDREEEAF